MALTYEIIDYKIYIKPLGTIEDNSFIAKVKKRRHTKDLTSVLKGKRIVGLSPKTEAPQIVNLLKEYGNGKYQDIIEALTERPQECISNSSVRVVN